MEFKYKNLKEIDSGGQARIFLADDTVGKRKVIIKTIKNDNVGNRRRFKREVRLLNEQSDNQFVVRLFETYLNASPPFIVLEHCAGGSLANWINKNPDVKTVMIAMQHAVLGLQGIHAKNGFHRDLSPRNILISFDSNGQWRAKLIDLGLGQTPNPLSGDMTRNYAGTPGYIAPEVEAGDDYTWRADIYSLGVTFREVLTGSKRKKIFDLIPPPVGITALLDEMTDEDPNKRPNTQYIFNRLTELTKEPKSISMPVVPQTGSTKWDIALGVLGIIGGIAAIVANANSYDPNVDRYRDSNGRFASGMFS